MTTIQPWELGKQKVRERQEKCLYTITWRGDAALQQFVGIAGFTQLAVVLGVKERSLRCYLATGKGQFTKQLTNPTTGEPDIATITRHSPPAKVKRPVGRPAKAAPDWERLGSEAPSYPTGTPLAPPARTVPKQTNRRTREKPQSKLPK